MVQAVNEQYDTFTPGNGRPDDDVSDVVDGKIIFVEMSPLSVIALRIVD